MAGQAENRGAVRISEHCRIAYRDLDQDGGSAKQTAAETINLSASGVCLYAETPLVPERHLALELTLKERDDPVVAVGRVVWCDRDSDGYRIGICFTWLRDEDRKDLGVIADYVARVVMGGAAPDPWPRGDSASQSDA
ncbi:MAG: PilZ domain-containing protein [Planctomycetota bacterium]|jgi:hypothetical protein